MADSFNVLFAQCLGRKQGFLFLAAKHAERLAIKVLQHGELEEKGFHLNGGKISIFLKGGIS